MSMTTPMIESAINAFILLFVVIDPVGVAPTYAALIRNQPPAASRATAVRGVSVALAIFVFFIFGGRALLRYLGVGMPAFTIAGGIRVFLLAIPMIAGPGSLTTVLLLTGDQGWRSAQTWMVLGVVAVILLITLIMLLAAQIISRALGETGVNVVARVFGIVLAALAVQYVSNGLHAIMPY